MVKHLLRFVVLTHISDSNVNPFIIEKYYRLKKQETAVAKEEKTLATTTTTGTLFAFQLVLSQNHTAIAQQQQLNGNSFQIDNMT